MSAPTTVTAGGPLNLLLLMGAAAFALTSIAGLPLLIWRALKLLQQRMDTHDFLRELRGQHTIPQSPTILDRMAVSEEQLALVLELARELAPNHGSSWRDEYRRDRDYQQQLIAALAGKLGVILPPVPTPPQPFPPPPPSPPAL